MTPKKAAKHKTAARHGSAAPEAETRQPAQEHRYVDVDPWAMLLEQLMEVPEEAPAERTRPKRK
jgi:hypothetical protein